MTAFKNPSYRKIYKPGRDSTWLGLGESWSYLDQIRNAASHSHESQLLQIGLGPKKKEVKFNHLSPRGKDVYKKSNIEMKKEGVLTRSLSQTWPNEKESKIVTKFKNKSFCNKNDNRVMTSRD